MRVHAIEEISLSNVRTGAGNLTVTNAVWVATALLHKNSPERDGFTLEEIVQLVKELNLTEGAEDSIWTHVRQHSVANKKPQPNTVCMLFDPGGGVRRLFRSGDKVYPGRNERRTHPKWEDLPAAYMHLRRWHEEEWNGAGVNGMDDPLFALIGTWKDEPADEYVAHLRANWGETR